MQFRMLRFQSVFLVTLGLFLGGTSHAGQGGPAGQGSDPSSLSDRDFALKAASSGQLIVALGRKAGMQACDQAVKRYAARVVRDHTRAMRRMMEIVAGKGIPVMTAMTQEHQGVINRIARLRGNDFDRAYIRQQQDAHRMSIEVFEAEARHGRDRELQAFAAQILPILRCHLEMAIAVESALGSGRDSAVTPH